MMELIPNNPNSLFLAQGNIKSTDVILIKTSEARPELGSAWVCQRWSVLTKCYIGIPNFSGFKRKPLKCPFLCQRIHGNLEE